MIFIGLEGLPVLFWILTGHGVPMEPKLDAHVYIISVLFPMSLGVVIWMVSPGLARWMVGKSEASGSIALLDTTRAQTVAFVVLGMWLAISALSELLVFAANLEWSDPFFWTKLLELAFSLCLIVGAKFLARLVRSVRDF
jgi:hypothetical protein